MKRAVSFFLLVHIWRRCRAVFNGIKNASVKCGRIGDAPHRAISRTTFIHGKSCGKEQLCRADLARHMQLCLPERHSGLLYVVRIAFRRVVECERVNCAYKAEEGRGSQW